MVYGFAGVECYDLILYLAKCIKVLGAEVCIADCSTDGSLADCIPGLEQGAFQTEFDGMLAVKGLSKLTDVLECAEGMEVLVYFGKTYTWLDVCNEVYFVTDQQKHNVRALSKISAMNCAVHKRLVVRGGFYQKITAESINYELENLGIAANDVLYLEDSAVDYENRLYLQYGVVKKLRQISQDGKRFLKFAIGDGCEYKALSKAIKMIRW